MAVANEHVSRRRMYVPPTNQLKVNLVKHPALQHCASGLIIPLLNGVTK